MSLKKRRKIGDFGGRREFRRPRGWTRWFHEGLLEPAGETGGAGVRLRTVLWGGNQTK